MADNTERLKELTKKFLGRPPYVIHRMPNAPREELNRLLPEHLEHQVRLDRRPLHRHGSRRDVDGSS